jgi:Holliday junction resolvasome RuvABC endonuclease subunit
MSKKLSDFRKEEIELAPVVKHRFQDNFVLAFDQSMASTGWVYLDSDDEGNAHVLGTGMIITTPTGLGSFEDTYSRMIEIEGEMQHVINALRPSRIVHEMPAVFGKRTEASLLASVVLRLVAHRSDYDISMIGAQRMKKIIAGKPNASKDEVKSAVKSIIPGIVKCKPLNEHIYDATAIGLSSMVI